MHGFMKKYVNEWEQKKKINGSSSVSISLKKRGRLAMLGSIDQKVKDILTALRHREGIASTTKAIAVAKTFFNGWKLWLINKESLYRAILGTKSFSKNGVCPTNVKHSQNSYAW